MPNHVSLMENLATGRYHEAIVVGCKLLADAKRFNQTARAECLEKLLTYLCVGVRNGKIDRYQVLQLEWEMGIHLKQIAHAPV